MSESVIRLLASAVCYIRKKEKLLDQKSTASTHSSSEQQATRSSLQKVKQREVSRDKHLSADRRLVHHHFLRYLIREHHHHHLRHESTAQDAMFAPNPRRDIRHVFSKSCLLRLPRGSGSLLRHSPRVLSRSTCLSCKSLELNYSHHQLPIAPHHLSVAVRGNREERKSCQSVLPIISKWDEVTQFLFSW